MALGSRPGEGIEDVGQGRGHGVRGKMVRDFPSPSIASRNPSHFWENAKPKEVCIKVPGPSKCPFKALEEDHGTLTLEESLDFSYGRSFYE